MYRKPRRWIERLPVRFSGVLQAPAGYRTKEQETAELRWVRESYGLIKMPFIGDAETETHARIEDA